MLHFHMHILSVFAINAVRRLRLYCCGLQRYALFWGDSFFRDALHYFVRYSFCGFFVTVVLLVSIQV